MYIALLSGWYTPWMCFHYTRSMKEFISFEQICKDCKTLSEHIQAFGADKIVAISRGGLVPAAIIANLLNIRYVGSIALASYDEDKKQSDIVCLAQPNVEIDEKTVFIDDLYDRGQTYKYVKEHFPQAKVAVIYNKNKNAKLDFPAKFMDSDLWLVFPWEVE